jgi:hypothetical protein
MGCSAGDASQGDDGVGDETGLGGGATGGSAGSRTPAADAGLAGRQAAGGTKSSGSGGAAGGSASAGGTTNAGGSVDTGGNGSAGGRVNTGGSVGGGGADAGPPHVAGACSGLGAVGAWEQITPPGGAADALTVGVALSAQNPSIVYASVGSWGGTRGIFRSTDCGATWARPNTGRNAAQITSGFQCIIVADPTNADVVYVDNLYGSPPTLYKTTNSGVDWDEVWGKEVTQYLTYNFVQDVSLEPGNPRHILANFHEDCVGQYAPSCMAESLDAGATWRVFKGPTSGWEEGAAVTILGPTTFVLAAPFNGLYYTKNSGAAWETVANDSMGNVYTTPDGTMLVGSAQHGMLKSSDGHTWASIPASPIASAILGDGTTLFTTYQNDMGGQPFYSAPANNPTTWSHVKTPSIPQGGSGMAYDADHHLLFSSNYAGGLWRVVTR